MTKQKIILIGAGGQCRSAIDVIEAEGKFEIAGILDKKEMLGKEISGYKVTGTDADLARALSMCANFHITVGHVASGHTRVRLFNEVRSMGGSFPVIISPVAYVSKNAIIGAGTIVMHNAVVNTGVRVGENCIINSKALLEHDSLVEDHCHISTGACINGDCVVKAGSFVGSNSVLVQGVTIAEENIIGAGSVILSDTEKNATYAGNPAARKK